MERGRHQRSPTTSALRLRKPSASEAAEALSELSGRDHEELKAFNEKRLWFESRLKLLEELPPISPFGQYRHAGTTENPHTEALESPSAKQLSELQMERDALEEEVLLFDDGDLVRMKEKTRVVTQSPLTPPSTELVSITLALIVVIDRLLSLLRQRSELLELCQLRLEWESLVASSFDDYTGIKDSIESVVDAYRKWRPGQTESFEQGGPTNDLAATASPGSTFDDTNNARLVGLQARLDELAKSDIPRSAHIIDRMIDLAAPLRNTSDKDDGKEWDLEAVPATLLDRQDDLEAQGLKLAQRLDLCRQLERSCAASSYSHFLLAAREIDDVAKSLQAFSLAPPFDPDGIAVIQDRMGDVERSLDEQCETPRVPTEMRNSLDDEHEHSVSLAIQEPKKSARRKMKEYRAAIDWFQRYQSAYTSIRDHRLHLTSRKEELCQLLNSHPESTATDSPSGCPANWLRRADAHLTATNNTVERDKQVTVDLTRFRAIASARPAVFRSATDLADDFAGEVDHLLDDVTGLRTTLVNRIDIIVRRRDLGKLLDEVTNLAGDMLADMRRSSADLEETIDRHLWPGTISIGPPVRTDWRNLLQATRQTFTIDISTRLRAIHHLISGGGVDAPRVCAVRDLVGTLEQEMCDAETLRSLFDRVQAQTSVVHTIQNEAQNLAADLRTASKDPAKLLIVREQVDAWDAEVAARVPFLQQYASRCPPTLPLAAGSHATALLTPPPSPPAVNSSRGDLERRWDLAAVDRAVRDEINQQTARVRGLLEQSYCGGSLTSTDDATAGGAYGGHCPKSEPSPASELDSQEPSSSVQKPESSSSTFHASRKIGRGQLARSLPKSASRSSLDSFSTHSRRGQAARQSATAQSESTPRKYVPKVDNQLDQAVGQIVNALDVHVRIAPVGKHEPYEWTDLTGSYWIGSEGRAKLCFCRILRSQTVMVRVGGGWVELSKFLADHFAESIATPESMPSSSTSVTPDKSSVNPAARHRKVHNRSPSTSSSFASLSRSTSATLPLSLPPGSPLTPLRFMRKASDSPDDRRKEKDRLKVGRRSILGKEPHDGRPEEV